MTGTGRSGGGLLRNFKAMGAAKFEQTLAAVIAEGDDPEAIRALRAEAKRRGLAVPQAQAKAVRPARARPAWDAAGLAMNAKQAETVGEALSRMIGEATLEPKLDGIRLLIHVTGKGVRMYARSGNSKTGKLPLIDRELSAAFPEGTWLDAEAVAFNDDLSQAWGKAHSVLGSGTEKAAARSDVIRLVVFDLLRLGDEDVRGRPLRERRAQLERVFKANKRTLKRTMLVAQFEATQENHDLIVRAGYEGTMVKDLGAAYQSGKRGWAWTKLKEVSTVDVVVMGYKPGKGKYEDVIGSIVFGQYVDGVLVERGSCSGVTDVLRSDITRRQKKLLGTVMEISYRTFMVDRRTGLPNYRHPQFERFRWDKRPEECVAEPVGDPQPTRRSR